MARGSRGARRMGARRIRSDRGGADHDLRQRPGAGLDPVHAARSRRSGARPARARGVHTAALSDGEELLVVAEDIGRHNTLDRLQGLCLIGGIETQGRILLATGRVSSEMLRKGARMGCPIIASRNSPTSMSVTLAEAWNITLIGYVRQRTMRLYSHPKRLGVTQPGVSPPHEPQDKVYGMTPRNQAGEPEAEGKMGRTGGQ